MTTFVPNGVEGWCKTLPFGDYLFVYDHIVCIGQKKIYVASVFGKAHDIHQRMIADIVEKRTSGYRLILAVSMNYKWDTFNRFCADHGDFYYSGEALCIDPYKMLFDIYALWDANVLHVPATKIDCFPK